MRQSSKTSPNIKHRFGWEPVADWYKQYMGKDGGEFQRELVFPGAMRLLDPKPGQSFLDIACGQGVFAKQLAKHARCSVTGLDASPTLIKTAAAHAPPSCHFILCDARAFGDRLGRDLFDGAVCLLALQNMDNIEPVLRDAAAVLRPGAPLVIVLNHPCFRQPRQSGWGWDEERKLQYRRVDRYMTSYEMPILAHPGSDTRVKTTSYHRPLTAYATALAAAGFVIDALEEWTSHKTSDSGPRAKAENVARKEIPMFMAIRARLTG